LNDYNSSGHTDMSRTTGLITNELERKRKKAVME